jgi:hypothetical protein
VSPVLVVVSVSSADVELVLGGSVVVAVVVVVVVESTAPSSSPLPTEVGPPFPLAVDDEPELPPPSGASAQATDAESITATRAN